MLLIHLLKGSKSYLMTGWNAARTVYFKLKIEHFCQVDTLLCCLSMVVLATLFLR